MTIPPPPPPVGAKAAMPIASAGVQSGIVRQPKQTNSSYGTASALPVIIAASALVVGAVPLIIPGVIWAAVLGYFFAGFITIMCLGWDSVSQRKGLSNPNFTLKPKFSLALRFIVALGFVIAVLNLIDIAMPIAEFLSNPGAA